MIPWPLIKKKLVGAASIGLKFRYSVAVVLMRKP